MNTLEEYKYLNTLPQGDVTIPERIVCAANVYYSQNCKEDEITLLGIRHGCSLMCDHYDDIGEHLDGLKEAQGFLTNKHRWVDRKEAWKIALKERQIVRLVGSQTPYSVYEETSLYSENLY